MGLIQKKCMNKIKILPKWRHNETYIVNILRTLNNGTRCVLDLFDKHQFQFKLFFLSDQAFGLSLRAFGVFNIHCTLQTLKRRPTPAVRKHRLLFLYRHGGKCYFVVVVMFDFRRLWGIPVMFADFHVSYVLFVELS